MAESGSDEEAEAETHQFRLGFTKTLPVVAGVIPFGLAYGVVAVQGGLTVGETLLMSLVVFAGASQFMAAGMFHSGVDGFTIVLSTLLINLRHLVMGLSLSPYLSDVKPAWQRMLAFGMVDESYLTSITHYREQGTERGSPHFMLASGLLLYAAWFAASLAGAIAGTSVSDPLTWGLDFAMPATFLTMLLPQLTSRRLIAVVVAAAAAAVVSFLLVPGKWYIIIAVAVGTVGGVLLEWRDERREAR
ncbi:MAG: AzlC family ABC transporter permease [Coriobacteriia bacterium]